MMIYRKPLALLCCLAAATFSVGAGATTFYVNNGVPAASDTGPGTRDTPFRTISAGVKAAKPGDTVMVAPGTYSELTPATDVAQLGVQVRSVGSASAPVTIQAQTAGSVTIDQGKKGVGFEIINSAYVTINGFVIQNCYGGGVHMEEGAPSSNITVENMTVNHCDGVAGDNVGGIYIGGCSNCTIVNNSINDIKVGGVYYENGAGIHGYGQTNCTLQNNQITNAYTGIFHKRSSGGMGLLIANNVISNVTLGIVYSVGGAGDPPHNNQRVYNNIIDASGSGIYALVAETSTPSQGLFIKHNVFLGSNAISVWGYNGLVIQDNIFYNLTSDAIQQQKLAWPAELTTMTNNLFYAGATFWLQQYASNAVHYTTLASFLAATGFSSSDNLVANPAFVAPSSGNYHLAVGSPAVGAADDGTNIGAYPKGTETVGLLSSPVNGGGTNPPAVVPNPPTNITVQ